MEKLKNWNVSVMTNPPAFHLCVTATHTKDDITNFITSLEIAITYVVNNPTTKLTGTLAVYGSSAKIETSLFTDSTRKIN